MRRRFVFRRLALAALGAGLVTHLGCGGGGGSNPTPPPDLARSALERSLAAWRDGAPPGPIAGGDPAVQAVDSGWQSGRKLESFEILREEPGEADRRFAVRLTLRDPAATEEVQYVVLGQGPVWVYRQDDYKRMIDMDNNPSPDKKRRKANR
jgi:hypothetical protein